MAGKEFNPIVDYYNDLYGPTSDETKRKMEVAQKEFDDYFNHVARTDDSIPGYENVDVDAGVLSGMLTDTPEIRKAALTWMNNLPDIDTNAIKRVIASKTFSDMYGTDQIDWKGNKNWTGSNRPDSGMTKLNPNIINGTLAGDPYRINDTVKVDDDTIKEQHVALNELLSYLKSVNAPKKVISNVLSLNGEYTDDYTEEDLYTVYDIIKDFLTDINADKKYFDYLEALFI